MRDRVDPEPTFLHLSMRPTSEREGVRTSTGPWALFGWTMITLVTAFAVLVIVLMVVFFSEPGAGA